MTIDNQLTYKLHTHFWVHFATLLSDTLPCKKLANELFMSIVSYSYCRVEYRYLIRLVRNIQDINKICAFAVLIRCYVVTIRFGFIK